MDEAGGVAPVIVTATFGAEDMAFLDALRQRHFPPERNFLRAHLTLFHHLPPSIEADLRGRLAEEARGARPLATLAMPMKLGRGVAYRVESPVLAEIRERLADAFAPLLMPQDRAPWRPHVTVQNKVEPKVAEDLHAALSAEHRPRPLAIAGLAAWHYRGGPWSAISEHRFRG